jgi:hypothetical protein
MKKYLTLIIVLLLIQKAKSDVVQPAYQYTLLNYSIKGIYSYEVAKKEKTSLLFSGGVGIVSPFFAIYEPVFGVEFLMEKRSYFKPKDYQGFFISGYLGVEYTRRESEFINDFALIPGFKLSRKSVISSNLVIEPHLGLSYPIPFNIYDGFYFPLPLATIGLRMGFCKLKS